MIEFVAGVAVGILVLLAWALADQEIPAEERRRTELLRQAMNALDRYGETRHLATAIRRELSDEAGA